MRENKEFRPDLRNDLVSVVVPAYNHENYVIFCLDSIFHNDHQNIELIIVDDGSTDSTFARAQEWVRLHKGRFSRVHLETQDNQGLTNTLNKLVSLAKGEYIVLLASDDALTSNSISKRLHKLKDVPNCKLVFGNCYVIDEESRVKSFNAIEEIYGGSTKTLSRPSRLTAELILRWSIPGPVVLAHRSVYDDVPYGRYNTELQVEDRDWYLKMLAKHKVVYLDDPISYYRFHASNTITNSSKKRRMLDDIAFSEKKNIRLFSGVDRLLLLLVYKRSLYEFKVYNKSSMLNRAILLLLKTVCRLALLLNRIL